MSLKRDEQRLALWEQWTQYKQHKPVSVQENTATLFAILKRAACDQVIADAVRFTRLGNSDEAIYSHVAELMAVYRRVVELAEEYQAGSSTVKALLMGICEVLNSRLREFDDVAATIASDGGNPVTAEKKGIIDKAIAFVSKHIEDQSRRFSTGLREDVSQEWDESFDIILQGEFHEMYVHYRDGLRFCLSHMDDLHARKITKIYTEQLEREWEELGNIINVQVQTLEEAQDEDIIIPGILDALRNAYKQIDPIVTEFQKLQQLPPLRPAPCRTFGEFEERVNKVLSTANPTTSVGRDFPVLLKDEVTTILDGLNVEFMKAAYKLQRSISEEVLLAEEVTDAFGDVLQEIPDVSQEEDVDSTERDILTGVAETIEIKIESLKESTQAFHNQGLDMVRALAVEKVVLPDEERQSIIDEAKTMWQTSPPDEISNVDEFFDMLLHGEAFQPCNERINKTILDFFDKSGKASMRFKKEILLYEVCTYEEILTHSVSRLRESANATIAEAATLLDKTFLELEVILKKNNISVIKPEPHQTFDAKEHEVLVAEKQEGFERGEIIKLVTAGYKQEDKIILRANVIAAR